MKLLHEFRTFAFKGNVIDLAVGVIIGAAFGKIVSSLVEDVITPLLLNPALDAVGAKNIAQLSWHGVTYGNFLSAVISFLCIALVLFWLIKAANKVVSPEEKAATVTKEQQLLTEIRDLLKNRTTEL